MSVEMGVGQWKPVCVSGAQLAGEACRRTATANIVADYLLHKQLMSANEQRTLTAVRDALLALLYCWLSIVVIVIMREASVAAAASSMYRGILCSRVAMPSCRSLTAMLETIS